jgi:hypothetical protein
MRKWIAALAATIILASAAAFAGQTYYDPISGMTISLPDHIKATRITLNGAQLTSTMPVHADLAARDAWWDSSTAERTPSTSPASTCVAGGVFQYYTFAGWSDGSGAIKGDKGDTGDPGADGQDGAPGAAGADGAPGADGADGADGVSAYVYIGFASDDSGSDFATSPGASLDYIAVLSTDTAIPSPQASDFAGLWKNYRGPQGDTGPTGPAGADGADGADGTSVQLLGSVDTVGDLPSGATAGDLYVVLADGNGYVSDGAEGWNNAGPIQGPQGETGAAGADGADGADGKTVLSGTSDPTTEGVDGDFYINTTSNTIFGPKATGTWPAGVSLVGPAGADGADGSNGTNGTDGADGASAYVYVAYASDDSGTGFTTTFNSSLDYIAILPTDTEIVSPQASDFTGLWKNYKGATGDAGATGEAGPAGADGQDGAPGAPGDPGADGADGASAYVYIAYASDASGTGFTTTFDADLDYIAVLASTSEITSPQASDFTGLWKNYQGADGATTAAEVSIADTAENFDSATNVEEALAETRAKVNTAIVTGSAGNYGVYSPMSALPTSGWTDAASGWSGIQHEDVYGYPYYYNPNLDLWVRLQDYDADLTTWAGITPASGAGTFLATPSLANFYSLLTDEGSATLHLPVGLGTANGLSLDEQTLSLAAATNSSAGAASAAHIQAIEANTSKVTMTYPGSGVPNSTGSAWGTSYGVQSTIRAEGSSTDTDLVTEDAVRDALDALPGGHNPVTIGTANGLSLSTQELSLAAATNANAGAATAAHIQAIEANTAKDTYPGTATTSAEGGSELATTAETTTGTAADRTVTPDGLSGSIYGQKEIGWSVVDSDTATAVADGKQGATIPASFNGMNLVDVTCSVANLNSATGGTTTVVLRRVRGATAADMTSTGVTIGYDEYTASDETVDTANDDVQTGDKIYVDINAVTTGAAQQGLHCTAVFQTP